MASLLQRLRRRPEPRRRGVLVGDETIEVPVQLADGRVRVPAADLARVIDGHLEDGVIRRRGTCTEVDTDAAGLVDLRQVIEAFDVPAAVEVSTDPVVVVVGRPADEWPLAGDLAAPDVELTDLDGHPVRLATWSGRRRVLLAFASWCGCRDDLPAWQQVVRTLPGPHEIDLVAIAVDERADDVRELAASVDLPVLLDRDRRFCEAYGVIHVPTVVWVDERDRVVRPNEVVFADDRLEQFHGIDHRPHHEELRRWSLTGAPALASEEVAAARMHPTADEQRARTEFRLATWLLRQGEGEAGRAHLDAAERLSPEDLTIRRAAIKLRGGDPLGADFAPVYEHWKQVSAGCYYRPRPAPDHPGG